MDVVKFIDLLIEKLGNLVTFNNLLWSYSSPLESVQQINRPFKLHKRSVAFAARLAPTEHCGNAFRYLGVLTLPCVHVFELISSLHIKVIQF